MMRDNPYNKFLELMREEGAYSNTTGVIIGVVKSVTPLLINIGKVDLDKDNLLVSSMLLDNYKRNVSIETSFNTENLDRFDGIITGDMVINDVGLKVDDKVAVIQLSNQVEFLIIDKVVRL